MGVRKRGGPLHKQAKPPVVEQEHETDPGQRNAVFIRVGVAMLVIGGLIVWTAGLGLAGDRMTAIPDRMIDDLCRLSRVAPTEIPRLTIGKRDRPAELLEGLRCPIVLKLESGWWEDKAFDLDRIHMHSPAKIAYDVGAAAFHGDFTYTDNDTALAPDILPRTATDGGSHPFASYVKAKRGKKERFFKQWTKNSSDPGTKSIVRLSSGISDFPELRRRLPDINLWAPKGSERISDWPQDLPADLGLPACTLWLSAEGVCSTAHFDSFFNLYTVMRGRKQVRLAPPESIATHFTPYPSAHPLARQSQKVFENRADGKPRTRKTLSPGPNKFGIMVTTLSAGEALYIPAGWVHEVESLETSVSISFTTLPHEFHLYQLWLKDTAFLLPFAVDRPTPADTAWSYERLASCFTVMLPVILTSLGFDITRPGNPLEAMVLRRYSPDVRRQLGIAPTGKMNSAYGCPTPTEEDRQWAHRGGISVAARFATMRKHLIPIYLDPYFETLLSKLGGSKPDRAADKVAQGVAFAEACWLGAWLPEGATTAVPVDTPFGREIAGASDDAIKARESEMVRAGATDTPVN